MGSSERRKGHNWEREVAKDLRDLFPDAKRGLQTQPGIVPPDVDGTPYHIECKVGKNPRLWAAWEQANRDTDGRPTVVVAKRDRQAPVVVLAYEEWLNILAILHDSK